MCVSSGPKRNRLADCNYYVYPKNYYAEAGMGKYEPLADHLRGLRTSDWAPRFTEIEDILGFSLPPSARKYREWWGNQTGAGHSQARGWQDAGWQVWKVDLNGERVIFRNPSSNRLRDERQLFEGKEDLFDLAAGYLGTRDRETIVQAALRALCEREAGRRLAQLGGTMPDLNVPPRRRFG
jgi:hypothetical protein